MKAMILAAGQGTRLKPYTDNIPKPMIRIADKPILQHIIESLSVFGIRNIVINLHHLSSVIQDYFGDGSRWDVDIKYSPEERLLGTAGALKPLSNFFDETFILWYGDNLCRIDLIKLIEFHHQKSGIATIALHQREDVSQSGVAELDGDSIIQGFLEKPVEGQTSSHWVNAGIYILEPQILKYIPSNQNCDFGRDLFPQILKSDHQITGYCMNQDEGIWWIDRIEDYELVLKNWE